MNIQEILRAGFVRRYHTVEMIGQQTTAEHSWGVAMILVYILGEMPPPELLVAALCHDVPEVYTGDVPATAKWSWPEIASAMSEAEDQIFAALGIDYDICHEHRMLLKAADMLELLHFCGRQTMLGNRNFDAIFQRGVGYFTKNPELLAHPRVESLLSELIMEYT